MFIQSIDAFFRVKYLLVLLFFIFAGNSGIEHMCYIQRTTRRFTGMPQLTFVNIKIWACVACSFMCLNSENGKTSCLFWQIWNTWMGSFCTAEDSRRRNGIFFSFHNYLNLLQNLLCIYSIVSIAYVFAGS